MNLAQHVLGNRHPERIALVCGDKQVTREELAVRVARAAGALRTLGVKPGEAVLIVMRNTPDFAADSRARFAIVEPSFATACGVFRDIRVSLAPAVPTMPFEAQPEAPAFCLYSSGTTGRPKAIVHEHRVAMSLGEAFRTLGVREGEYVFTTSKLFFAYGLEHGLLAPLANGVSSVLSADRPDADTVIGIVERLRPRVMFSVPTLYRRLLAESRKRLRTLGAVGYFVAAGERLSPQLVSQWRVATGGELLNLYGMSEAFCACMMTPPGTSDGVRTGKPFPIAEVRLVDGTGGEPAPGEPGELWLRHPAQARGYANRPQETRAQFREGWFCSHDLFVRDAEGFYVHQGRTDELVKVAGQWVWPAELEQAALAAATVAEAACVPVADGEGLQRLALFVTARGDKDPTHAAAVACEGLPRHKRPKWIRCVAELPRTATGKVQRYKLREILERELERSG
jgi:3-hydroxybenzoate/4-hydroxybenzoate---CoA ligase